MSNRLIIGISTLLLFWIVGCKKPQQTVEEANVKSSPWLSTAAVSTLKWQEKTLDGIGKALTLELTDPDITEETVRNSVMLVYGRLHGYESHIWPRNQVKLLRALVEYQHGFLRRSDVWSAYLQPGKITILLTNAANEYAPYGPSPKNEFRYVFVPKTGSVATGKKPSGNSAGIMARYSESDLRNMSYEQFCSIAGLEK